MSTHLALRAVRSAEAPTFTAVLRDSDACSIHLSSAPPLTPMQLRNVVATVVAIEAVLLRGMS